MKNQRRRLLALIAVVLVCVTVLPFIGACSKEEKEESTKTAEEAAKTATKTEAPAASQTPVATKSDPNAPSLQSTPNKGGNKKVTSGTNSVKSEYSKQLEALAKIDINKVQNVQDRRDYVEAYMRAMLTIEWTVEDRVPTQAGTTGGKTYYLHDYASEEAWQSTVDGASGVMAADTYTYKVGSYTFPMKSGRVYRGLPYSNGDSGLETFNLFVKETNADGVAVMNDRFDVVYLYGGEAIARIGNTATTALIYAWNTVSYTSRATSTTHMVPTNGYYFVEGVKVPELTEAEREAAASKPPVQNHGGTLVGSGVADKLDITYDRSLSGDTDEIVAYNGEQGMYAAYANAQKADGLIRSDGSNDAKMVVSVNVVKNADGTIDGEASYITVLSQTYKNFQDEVVDENGVYIIGEVDRKMTFKELFDAHFVPMTVKELIDGTPSSEAMVRDGYEYTSYRTGSYLYSGVMNGSRRIIWVTTEIKDEAGNTLFKNIAFAERSDVKVPAATETGRYIFDIAKLDDSHEKIVSIGDDVISNSTLGKGTFHYTLTAHMITGEDIVVRDYTYTNK